MISFEKVALAIISWQVENRLALRVVITASTWSRYLDMLRRLPPRLKWA